MYKLANRLVDRITGFNIDAALKESLAFDYWDRDQIDQFHQQKFEILSDIASKSEFYSAYRGGSLMDYPLMTRENFARSYPTLFTNQVKPFHVRKSTGSTSLTITHNVTREMLLAKRVSHQKMLHWHGLTRESSELKIGGVPADLKTKIYYYLRNKRFVNSYQIVDEDVRKIIRKYNRFRPRILYGYPSVLNYFIMRAQILGIELNPPELIVVHAENLYPEIETRFRKVFPEAGVANQYWSTEACIAETCPHGNLHIAEDIIVAEVRDVDKDGVGNLYITNLFSFAVPYIRYQIGDRIKLADAPCSCGRTTKVIEYIEGREIELIDLPDGRKYPVTALHFSPYTGNILAHQLFYSKTRKKVIIKYIPVRKEIEVQEKEIAAYWKEHFDITAEFEQVSRLEYAAGGKFKMLNNME